MASELPDFILTPSAIITDKRLQPLDGYVFGIVYWYSKLKLQKCIVSNAEIGRLLRASGKSVSNSLQRLHKHQYVRVVLNKQNQREEIIPLISFNKKDEVEFLPNPTSNDVPPYIKNASLPTSNDVQNKNILIKEFNNINIYTKILDYWNSKEIIKHRIVTDRIKRAINGRIAEKYTPGEILQAIDNYDFILKSDQYFFSYKWTLQFFLQRGFEKFLDLDVAKQNYKKGGYDAGYKNPNSAEKGKYSNIKYEGE